MKWNFPLIIAVALCVCLLGTLAIVNAMNPGSVPESEAAALAVTSLTKTQEYHDIDTKLSAEYRAKVGSASRKELIMAGVNPNNPTVLPPPDEYEKEMRASLELNLTHK